MKSASHCFGKIAHLLFDHDVVLLHYQSFSWASLNTVIPSQILFFPRVIQIEKVLLILRRPPFSFLPLSSILLSILFSLFLFLFSRFSLFLLLILSLSNFLLLYLPFSLSVSRLSRSLPISSRNAKTRCGRTRCGSEMRPGCGRNRRSYTNIFVLFPKFLFNVLESRIFLAFSLTTFCFVFHCTIIFNVKLVYK